MPWPSSCTRKDICYRESRSRNPFGEGASTRCFNLRSPGLLSLSLGNLPEPPHWLPFLFRFPSLTHLALWNAELSDANLAPLIASLTQLRTTFLKGSEIGPLTCRALGILQSPQRGCGAVIILGREDMIRLSEEGITRLIEAPQTINPSTRN